MPELNYNLTDESKLLISNGSLSGSVTLSSISACNLGDSDEEVSVFVRRRSDNVDFYYIKEICRAHSTTFGESLNIPGGYSLYISCSGAFSVNASY